MEYEHSQAMANDFSTTQWLMQQPHVLLKPRVFKDGNMWCCLYGKEIMEGVCGFGATPELACEQFNKIWWNGDGE